jgi:SPP1 gp7 family putative phage head morphogenesis protein
MRTLREVLNPVSLRERKSVVGSLNKNVSVFKDKVYSPHQISEELERAYATEPIFRSAIDTVTDFVYGGDIIFKSDDKMTEVRGNALIKEWGLNEWIPQGIRSTIKTGNGYVEIDFNPITGLPQKFYPLAMSSRMYINCNEYGEPLLVNKVVFDEQTKSYTQKQVPNDEEYYIQQLDPNMPHKDAKWYNLTYNYGSKFFAFRVYGIPIHKEKIIHFKMNLGTSGIYGTTHFESGIDDRQILRDMERSIAVISRYKAVPRKILQYGDKDNPATGEEIDDFIVYLESLEKDEDPIVNKPVKIDDLSYSGKDINLGYMLEHIRKKLISGVVPDFLTGFGNDVNRSTAQVQLIAFVLSIYAKRKSFLYTLEEKLIKPWLEHEGLQEGHLEFNELDFETKQEKTQRVMQLWSGNMITLNRALDMLGENKIGDEGENYYTKWQNDMMSPPQLEQPQPVDNYPHTLLPGGTPINQEPETQTPFEDDATTMPPEYSLQPESFRESIGSLEDDPAGLDPIINRMSFNIRSVYNEKLNKVKSTTSIRKIERLSSVKEDLREKDIRELAMFLRTEEGNVRPHVDKAIEEAWVKGNLDSARRIGLQSHVLTSAKKMEEVKNRAWSWVNKFQNTGANKIEDVLTQGIVGKYKGNELEENINKAYSFVAWKSEQIAKTELRKAYSEGVRHVMLNSPFKEYVWRTSAKENVCKVCNSLNGRKFRVEDIRQPMSPLHPNCRCACEIVVDR